MNIFQVMIYIITRAINSKGETLNDGVTRARALINAAGDLQPQMSSFPSTNITIAIMSKIVVLS